MVAHEVRNPLMIIKSSLHPLRSDSSTRDDVKMAVADIDEEVAPEQDRLRHPGFRTSHSNWRPSI